MSTAMGQSPAGFAHDAIRRADLVIGGMTCASCAARIEKKLSRLDGVTATVNFATETAHVSFPAAVSPGDMISVVEQAGYTASLPSVRQDEAPGQPEQADDGGKAVALRRLLLVSVLLTMPVVVLA